MIEDSDDDSATDLWNEEGGTRSRRVRRLGRYGLHHRSYAWGLTVTTAADQVALLEHLVESNPVLTAASRGLRVRADGARHAQPGVGSVGRGATRGDRRPQERLAPGGRDLEVNSIGWVDGGGHNYLIAVLSSGDPSESYGIDSISLVAEAAWGRAWWVLKGGLSEASDAIPTLSGRRRPRERQPVRPAGGDAGPPGWSRRR